MGEKGSSGDAADVAKPSSSSSNSSSSSSAARPLQGPVPTGRKAWELWRTRFVLDERYAPIKVSKIWKDRERKRAALRNLVGAEW